MPQQRRVATALEWALAPEWLTLDQACFLSGWDPDTMRMFADEGGVDLNTEGLIEKHSLWELQETAALILHWND